MSVALAVIEATTQIGFARNSAVTQKAPAVEHIPRAVGVGLEEPAERDTQL
jgi:hypothetical protein